MLTRNLTSNYGGIICSTDDFFMHNGEYQFNPEKLEENLTSNHGGIICSTDDFFMHNGEYQFNPEKLEEYHRNNILRVREAMKDGIKPIIVDNTISLQIIWNSMLFMRNVHGVTKAKIHAMLQSLEEQGKPSLSQLVGKGRQVKLEPPCELLENGVLEHIAPTSSSDIVLADVLAKLFPNGLHVNQLPPSVSLAPDPRPHIRVVAQRDMATQTNEVVGWSCERYLVL
ncbi:unnamed protein product [Strongylus vulgaris]|uniref:Uncharacterized protein n=1 Tax=Strongylus vulgaris TaxID=40348 RepID=A0A3P7J2Q7_STRVU|nr:unnamed protein product [Strongylus vulgaris]